MSQLFYSRSGQGEPLLILHGLFGSSRNWQSLARRYAEHFDVISVDLRNHGQSLHSEAMDYRVMAEDVKQLIESLDLPAVRIIGHSMGGKVTLRLAIDHANLIDRIVVADIAPVNYQHDHNDTLDAMLAVDLAEVVNRADADEQMKPVMPEAPLRAFLLQNLVRQDNRWQWRVNLKAIETHMSKLTGFDFPESTEVDTPSLFIFGSKSDYVGESAQQLIRSQFSHSTLQPVEGAGHWLHAEKPDLFFDLTLEYLRA